MDLSHLAARTHEPISTDCEEAEAEIKRLETERDHWQRMAAQYQTERDSLRRTLADLLGMHPAEACPECGDTEPHRHLATT